MWRPASGSFLQRVSPGSNGSDQKSASAAFDRLHKDSAFAIPPSYINDPFLPLDQGSTFGLRTARQRGNEPSIGIDWTSL